MLIWLFYYVTLADAAENLETSLQMAQQDLRFYLPNGHQKESHQVEHVVAAGQECSFQFVIQKHFQGYPDFNPRESSLCCYFKAIKNATLSTNARNQIFDDCLQAAEPPACPALVCRNLSECQAYAKTTQGEMMKMFGLTTNQADVFDLTLVRFAFLSMEDGEKIENPDAFLPGEFFEFLKEKKEYYWTASCKQQSCQLVASKSHKDEASITVDLLYLPPSYENNWGDSECSFLYSVRTLETRRPYRLFERFLAAVGEPFGLEYNCETCRTYRPYFSKSLLKSDLRTQLGTMGSTRYKDHSLSVGMRKVVQLPREKTGGLKFAVFLGVFSFLLLYMSARLRRKD